MRNLPQNDMIFRLQVGDASHEDNPIISYCIIWYPIDVSPSRLWRSLSPRLSSWCRKVCTKLSNDFHGIFPRISLPQTIQDPTIRSLKKTPKKTVYFPWNQWVFLQDNPIYETVMDADIVTNGVSTDVLLEKFKESLGAARASWGSVGGHGVVGLGSVVNQRWKTCTEREGEGEREREGVYTF